MISDHEFNSLEVGDRVICNYGSEAEVLKTGITDSFNKKPMVKLRPDEKMFSCPYFFQSEIKQKI